MKIFISVVIIIFGFFVFSLNPDFTIKNKYQCNNITIHYDNLNNIEKICDDLSSIKEKALIKDNINIDIYFINSSFKYKLYTYFSNSFSYGNILLKKTFIKTNFNDNYILALSFIKAYLLTTKQCLDFIFIPEWKIIGYSKYIYGEIPNYQEKDICNPLNREDYLEFENMVVVKYLFNYEHYNQYSFFNDNISYDVYLSKTKSLICKN